MELKTLDNTNLKNTAVPQKNNSTEKYENTGESKQASSAFSNIAESFSLNGITFKVESFLRVASGEADLYIVTDKSGQRFIFKYYRQGIDPKLEVIEKLKSLSPERVIKIVDSGIIDNDRFYELQEYAEGGSLDQFIKANNGIPLSDIKLIVNEIALCLNEIHSKNIIHRDIKPANILIRSFSPLSIVLTDFGISSVSEEQIHQTNFNRTISYSAPEAMTGVVSMASDYWSLGMITLEMLTNCHPFEGLDAKMIMYFLTTHNIPGIDNVQSEFEPLVKGLLTQNDKYRWQFDEVKKWLDGEKNIPVYYESKFISDFMKNEKNKAVPIQADDGKIEDINDLKIPVNFNGKNYLILKELADAMTQNWQAAVQSINSEKLKEKLEVSIIDPGIKALLKQIGKGQNLSNDNALFEIICAINPETDFYYMGHKVNETFLKENAVKISGNTANDLEKNIFNELIYGGIIRKYHEFTCREKIYESIYQNAVNECLKTKDLKQAAGIILKKMANIYAAEEEQKAEPAAPRETNGNSILVKNIFSIKEKINNPILIIAAIFMLAIIIAILINFKF